LRTRKKGLQEATIAQAKHGSQPLLRTSGRDQISWEGHRKLYAAVPSSDEVEAESIASYLAEDATSGLLQTHYVSIPNPSDTSSLALLTKNELNGMEIAGEAI
jgi:hypothetical protein